MYVDVSRLLPVPLLMVSAWQRATMPITALSPSPANPAQWGLSYGPIRIILWLCFGSRRYGRTTLPWTVDASFTNRSRGSAQPSATSLCNFWYKQKQGGNYPP